MVAAALNTVLVLTAEPPLEAVYQPLNVYPLRVGVGKDESLPSEPVVAEVELTEPPLASKVMV